MKFAFRLTYRPADKSKPEVVSVIENGYELQIIIEDFLAQNVALSQLSVQLDETIM